MSLEIHCSEMITLIESAFADIVLGQGRTLRQGRVLDDDGTDEELLEAARAGIWEKWQDVPESELIEFQDAIPFLDACGFRFHLPAIMRLVLQTWTEAETDHDCSHLMNILGAGPLGTPFQISATLTSCQLAATAGFIWLIAHSNDSNAVCARHALSCGWSSHVPDFLLSAP